MRESTWPITGAMRCGGAPWLRSQVAQVRPEVVRADGRDAGAVTGGVEIAADVEPRGEERIAGTLGVGEGMLEEGALVVRDDRDLSVAGCALG
jgi:hypothetical protein